MFRMLLCRLGFRSVCPVPPSAELEEVRQDLENVKFRLTFLEYRQMFYEFVQAARDQKNDN